MRVGLSLAFAVIVIIIIIIIINVSILAQAVAIVAQLAGCGGRSAHCTKRYPCVGVAFSGAPHRLFNARVLRGGKARRCMRASCLDAPTIPCR